MAVALDATDNNWQVIRNDNAGTGTKIDLGTSFTRTGVGVIYEARFFAASNDNTTTGTSIGYQISNVSSGGTATGTMTTDLPSPTGFMAFWVWANTGTSPSGTATGAMIEFSRIYVETDI